MENKNKYL